MKKIAVLLVIAGLVFLIIGGYQLIRTKKAQNENLAKAEVLLSNDKKVETDSSSMVDFSPKKGETVGILHIPQLDSDLPIVEGTDADELAKGVGHYSGTAYPSQGDQIVLSGHRDTVFRRMGELEIGDIMTVKLSHEIPLMRLLIRRLLMQTTELSSSQQLLMRF